MNPAYGPMLATLVNKPFDHKAMGSGDQVGRLRLITEKSSDIVRLWSRNGIDVTRKYGLPALRRIEGSCVITTDRVKKKDVR